MSESDIVCEWYCTFRCKDIKGAVHQCFFDVKPFNGTISLRIIETIGFTVEEACTLIKS